MTGFARHALGLVLAAALAQPTAADVITDWNTTAQAVMKAANTGGNPATRNLAMMHVAMSDAVNIVQNKYALYVPAGMLAPGASVEAAAAAAEIAAFPSSSAGSAPPDGSARRWRLCCRPRMEQSAEHSSGVGLSFHAKPVQWRGGCSACRRLRY